jgi:hypothetical protein
MKGYVLGIFLFVMSFIVLGVATTFVMSGPDKPTKSGQAKTAAGANGTMSGTSGGMSGGGGSMSGGSGGSGGSAAETGGGAMHSRQLQGPASMTPGQSSSFGSRANGNQPGSTSAPGTTSGPGYPSTPGASLGTGMPAAPGVALGPSLLSKPAPAPQITQGVSVPALQVPVDPGRSGVTSSSH